MATALLKEFSVGGLRGETGTFTLSGGTVEVDTKLRAIVSAQVSYSEDPAADSRLYCDGTITSGAVTVASSTTAAKSGFYTFLGYV